MYCPIVGTLGYILSEDHRQTLLIHRNIRHNDHHLDKYNGLGGKMLPDEVAYTYYGLEWGNDNRTLFYTTLDAAKRPFRIHRHRLGTPPETDMIVFEEEDERFSVTVSKSKSICR